MIQQDLLCGVEFVEGEIDERGYNGPERGYLAKIEGKTAAWGTATWWSWFPGKEDVPMSMEKIAVIDNFFRRL